MNTNLVGTITEFKCLTHFMELGYNVSVPQSPTRYDFILDTGVKLLRVQTKTANIDSTKEFFYFSTCSSHYVQGKHTHTSYSANHIDYFCTYWDNQCYLIPIKECGKAEKRLRLLPTRNGQVKGVSFAKDYLGEEVLKKYEYQ